MRETCRIIEDEFGATKSSLSTMYDDLKVIEANQAGLQSLNHQLQCSVAWCVSTYQQLVRTLAPAYESDTIIQGIIDRQKSFEDDLRCTAQRESLDCRDSLQRAVEEFRHVRQQQKQAFGDLQKKLQDSFTAEEERATRLIHDVDTIEDCILSRDREQEIRLKSS